jgi:hypothetical protein
MLGVTVAVKVTDWLTVVVEEEATTLVVVVVSPTGCSKEALLAPKFASPVYAAVTV